ncbi:STAS domain-containing protein [Plantactinospora sp. WMMB782]|uniref:STAS domain-containing protein n=1 Tax=Plantactinospora sp. WMMB782 TaxID=3404121 RepID=UPI003B93B6B6
MDDPVRSETEQVDDQLVVRLFGHLDSASVAAVRHDLLGCLAEQPAALVVDLTALTVGQPASFDVFVAVARQATVWPGTPLRFCGTDTATSALLASDPSGGPEVFHSIDRALAAGVAAPRQTVSELLLPARGAARRARDMVTEACLRWGPAELVGPASLVASELVGNAVAHAGTLVELRVSMRSELMIGVRDGSAVEPRLAAVPVSAAQIGRGLLLVDTIARRWGSIPVAGGKVVWAALGVDGG